MQSIHVTGFSFLDKMYVISVTRSDPVASAELEPYESLLSDAPPATPFSRHPGLLVQCV